MKKLSILFLGSLIISSCSQKSTVEEKIDSYCQSTVKANLTEYYTLVGETQGHLKFADDDDSRDLAVEKYNHMISYFIFKYDSSFSDVFAGDVFQAKDLIDSNKEVMAQMIMDKTKASCAYELSSISKIK